MRSATFPTFSNIPRPIQGWFAKCTSVALQIVLGGCFLGTKVVARVLVRLPAARLGVRGRLKEVSQHFDMGKPNLGVSLDQIGDVHVLQVSSHEQ